MKEEDLYVVPSGRDLMPLVVKVWVEFLQNILFGQKMLLVSHVCIKANLSIFLI